VHRASARTARDGRFAIDGALDHGALVVAEAGDGQRFEVGPARAGVPVKIVVDALREVAGRVIDEAGQPAASATVWVERDGAWITDTTTDVDGRFALPVTV